MHSKVRLLKNGSVPLLILALGLTLLVTLGCGQSSDEPAAAQVSEDERLAQLRSLPYAGGMPAQRSTPSGVTHLVTGAVASGYRLYTVPMLGRADLISESGKLVHSWETPDDRWERAVLTQDGSLLVVGLEDMGWSKGERPGSNIPDSARYLAKLDWSGKQVWRRTLLLHHDVEVTREGKILALVFKRRLIPEIHPAVRVRDDELVLLDADGRVLDSRSLYDGTTESPDRFPLQVVEPTIRSDREWVDLFHSNSVESVFMPDLAAKDPVYAAGNILVSVRHQDRVVIYNWYSSEFVWSWGRGEISGPHDASMLASGNVLLFDNGLGREWSRAIEVDPVNDEVVWTYEGKPRESFYTASKGSAQRLPNGNTLLAESDRGRSIEVTPDGEVVWEFICPYFLGPEKRAAIVRMTHYDLGFLELNPEDSE